MKSLAGFVCAVAAFAQVPDRQPEIRTLHLGDSSTRGAYTDQNFEEMATLLRQVADVVPQFPLVRASGDIVVSGTEDQLAMSGWLVTQLTNPAKDAVQRFSGANNRVAEVFHVHGGANPQSVQALVTTLREVGEITHLFNYGWDAIALQGTADEVHLAEWLVAHLQQPGAEPATYDVTDARGRKTTIAYLKSDLAPADYQALMRDVRTVANVRHAFVYQAGRAIAMRSQPEQLAMAKLLIAGREKPASR